VERKRPLVQLCDCSDAGSVVVNEASREVGSGIADCGAADCWLGSLGDALDDRLVDSLGDSLEESVLDSLGDALAEAWLLASLGAMLRAWLSGPTWSAANVCISRRPLTCSPFDCWNRFTAALVFGPAMPSTGPAL
jgi:hypothetical protein